MTGLDDKLTSAVIRMHNRLNDRMMYASALSTSVTLFLSMKHLGFEPKLILGTIQFQGLSYPHAWIELDDKIFDLATSQDIKYHPVLKDRELAAVKPMINIAYEEASSSICYYPFQFGATWELANMYKAVGKTLEKYMDESGKFNLNDSNLITYSHGQYFTFGQWQGKFGYSVKKKNK